MATSPKSQPRDLEAAVTILQERITELQRVVDALVSRESEPPEARKTNSLHSG